MGHFQYSIYIYTFNFAGGSYFEFYYDLMEASYLIWCFGVRVTIKFFAMLPRYISNLPKSAWTILFIYLVYIPLLQNFSSLTLISIPICSLINHIPSILVLSLILVLFLTVLPISPSCTLFLLSAFLFPSSPVPHSAFSLLPFPSYSYPTTPIPSHPPPRSTYRPINFFGHPAVLYHSHILNPLSFPFPLPKDTQPPHSITHHCLIPFAFRIFCNSLPLPHARPPCILPLPRPIYIYHQPIQVPRDSAFYLLFLLCVTFITGSVALLVWCH